MQVTTGVSSFNKAPQLLCHKKKNHTLFYSIKFTFGYPEVHVTAYIWEMTLCQQPLAFLFER